MKTAIFVLSFSLTFLSSTTAQVDQAYTDTLSMLLEASGARNTFSVVIDQSISFYKQQYDEVPDAFWDELQKEMGENAYDDLVKLLAPIYYEHLNQEDLEAILAFYRSPAGRKMAQKTPLITAAAMQAGQEWGRQVGQQIVTKLLEEGY